MTIMVVLIKSDSNSKYDNDNSNRIIIMVEYQS